MSIYRLMILLNLIKNYFLIIVYLVILFSNHSKSRIIVNY